MPDFVENYVCDPSARYHGFKSWDDFFTRLFRPSVRPVMFPDNDDIVNSACESTVYCIASNIQALDTFWLKGEPYSLNYMLNNDDLAPPVRWRNRLSGFSQCYDVPPLAQPIERESREDGDDPRYILCRVSRHGIPEPRPWRSCSLSGLHHSSSHSCAYLHPSR